MFRPPKNCLTLPKRGRHESLLAARAAWCKRQEFCGHGCLHPVASPAPASVGRQRMALASSTADDVCEECGRFCGAGLPANGRAGTATKICRGCLLLATVRYLWIAGRFDHSLHEAVQPLVLQAATGLLEVVRESTVERCLGSCLSERQGVSALPPLEPEPEEVPELEADLPVGAS